MHIFKFVAALVSLATLLPAEEKPRFETPTKENRVTPLDLLREFEAPEEKDYLLGEGDEIQISVWGRAELSGKHTVGPDGNITLPYVGPFPIANLTRTETDPEKRRKAYHDLAAAISKDRAVIYLYHQRPLFALNAKVSDVEVTGDGYLLFRGMKMAK